MSSLPSIVLLANKENRSKEVWERDLVVGGFNGIPGCAASPRLCSFSRVSRSVCRYVVCSQRVSKSVPLNVRTEALHHATYCNNKFPDHGWLRAISSRESTMDEIFVKGCHEQVLWSWLQIGPILCPPEAIKLLARRRPMLPAFNAPMHAKSSTQDDIQRNHPRPTAIADSSTIDCFSSTVINVIFQRSPIIPDWN
uniref:Uncharacterized protein n=1 Tax=Vespula pensylvanica TaxID=30213 RepID=A0A834NPZ5_VESPE|nr:hypothetical protein H0235_011993 [Vespula pensylvanica]